MSIRFRHILLVACIITLAHSANEPENHFSSNNSSDTKNNEEIKHLIILDQSIPKSWVDQNTLCSNPLTIEATFNHTKYCQQHQLDLSHNEFPLI